MTKNDGKVTMRDGFWLAEVNTKDGLRSQWFLDREQAVEWVMSLVGVTQ